MSLTLECQKRPEKSKPNALRRSGFLPAILYGHNGAESIPLTVSTKSAESLLKKASVNNTLIDLNIPELNWSGKTLIREVQSHPWKPELYHISFFAVATHGDIEIGVPIHLIGDAIGVKQEGGLLDPVLTHLTIRCLPDRIPQAINVDIAQLHRGSAIHVRELSLPEGITAVNDGEQVVVTIVATQLDSSN